MLKSQIYNVISDFWTQIYFKVLSICIQTVYKVKQGRVYKVKLELFYSNQDSVENYLVLYRSVKYA